MLSAKPVMELGDSAFDSLLDPLAKVTPKSSKLMKQMVRQVLAVEEYGYGKLAFLTLSCYVTFSGYNMQNLSRIVLLK